MWRVLHRWFVLLCVVAFDEMAYWLHLVTRICKVIEMARVGVILCKVGVAPFAAAPPVFVAAAAPSPALRHPGGRRTSSRRASTLAATLGDSSVSTLGRQSWALSQR